MDGRRVGGLSIGSPFAPTLMTGVDGPRGPRVATDVGVCGGLVILVVGTFLPWVRSGRATRNGYASGGLLRRLLEVDRIESVALTLVPFLALACAAAVVLVLAGHGTGRLAPAVVGRIVAVVVAGCAGAGSVVALTADPTYGVAPEHSGPVATIVGGMVVWAAASVSFARSAVQG